jgi:DNA-binding transcriptional ArsR family regulator
MPLIIGRPSVRGHPTRAPRSQAAIARPNATDAIAVIARVTSPDRFSIDAYVVDALMPDLVGHDRHASAFVLYLFLWRRTRGAARPTVVSHRMMADATGLAKRSVQSALRRLEERGLVDVRRATVTSAPSITLRCDWRQ